MAVSPPVVPSSLRRCYDTCGDSRRASDAILQKIDDTAEEPRRPLNAQIDVMQGAPLACRPGQQARRSGECRAGCRVGQAPQRAWTAETHLLVENAPRQFARP